MTPDPDDATLLEFVARFAGWSGMELTKDFKPSDLKFGMKDKGPFQQIPDYLGSLDMWHRDVWAKIKTDDQLADIWAYDLCRAVGPIQGNYLNATARERCLALYRCLDGKLPGETTTQGDSSNGGPMKTIELSVVRDLDNILEKLEKIVCHGGADAGIILISDDSPTHVEEYQGRQISVYDYEYFSPLGGALIDLHQSLTSLRAKCAEIRITKPLPFDSGVKTKIPE